MPALALLWPSDIGLRPDGEQITCVFFFWKPLFLFYYFFSFLLACSIYIYGRLADCERM